jgi:CheY-like chemotaxis protein
LESRHDELIALVSRELRIPLHAMLGWAQMLLAHERFAGDEQLSRGLDIIIRNAKAQGRLIDALIDASSLLDGSLRLSIAPLPVEPAVRAAIEGFASVAQGRGVDVNVRVEQERLYVLADGERLHQVLWSLLDNALKFSPPNGAIDVRVRQEDGRACIEIEDDGPGVEAELLPVLFERFSQGKAGRTGNAGLGLGLAIARGLVELQHGVLEVDRAGRGARFCVRLPIAPPRRAHDPAPHSPPPMLEGTSLDGVLDGVRIAIVDDAHEAVEPMRAALEQAGASVRAHGSAQAALNELLDGAGRVDALIADMRADEGRLLQTLRSSGFAAPAIALTGQSAPRDRLRALQAGFQMHVAKPVDGHELLVTVASVLGKFLPDGR